jgi:hypothetical protein
MPGARAARWVMIGVVLLVVAGLLLGMLASYGAVPSR